MKQILIVITCLCSSFSYAQYPNDVVSEDAIIKALYDVISGPSTQNRDWDRFRNLFTKEARMMTVAIHKDSGKLIRTITPEQYIERNGKRLQEIGFIETELNRITESYGAVTHAFSTYKSDFTINGTPIKAQGINIIQLFKHVKRFYIVSVYWDGDSKLVMPKKYQGQ
ncbi:MAG: hypothetical protein IBJ16_07805 [Chitinophagaceae bacterium]|nr:hypothetical protein [Chitinophagaceae bacterium]